MKSLLNFVSALAAAVLCCLGVPGASAQGRMMLFSDPHLLSASLVDNPGQAYTDMLNGNDKMIDQSVAVLDALVETALDQRPAAVLVAGDLTKDGERQSHLDMAEQLARLRQAGIGVYVVPGNHDVNSTRAVAYIGNQTPSVPTVTSAEFAEIYADMGYSQAVARDAGSLSYVAEPVPGVWLIAVDDCRSVERDASPSLSANGLSAATLKWVTDQVSLAGERGKQPIVMMHHHLVEHFDGEGDLMASALVSGAAAVRERFEQCGVGLVLTGHMHISDIAVRPATAGGSDIVEVTTGAPITYPCHYRNIDVSSERTRFAVGTGMVERVAGNDDFQTYALQRLRNSAKAMMGPLVAQNWSIVQSMLDEYGSLIGNVSITPERAAEIAYQAMGADLTRLLVAFAQGNEPTRDVAGLRQALLVTGVNSMVDIAFANYNSLLRSFIKPIARAKAEEICGPALDSVLADANGYGTSQQRVINDLTYTVALPAPPVVPLDGDVNGDGQVDVDDVNRVINAALGIDTLGTCDLTADGQVDVADVNTAINLALDR